MKISVIVPVYNEGEGVEEAYEAIVDVLRTRLPQHDHEILFVDDGSRDDSFVHLAQLAALHPNVRVLKLASNCGAHMAIRAGLEHAQGDVACFLACDLQDPPETIVALLDALKEPVQIVWAVRNSRDDSWSARLLARLFYFLARLFATKSMAPSGASMFLLGPLALSAVPQYRERNLTLEGLFATMGFPQAYVKYERHARRRGKSKWTWGKRLKLFADFFVAYSYAPIRIMSYLGILIATLGFLYAFFVFGRWVLVRGVVPGWTSLIIAVFVIGGFQMLMMGVLGEYLWRTLDEVRARPKYLIETMLNPQSSDNGDKL